MATPRRDRPSPEIVESFLTPHRNNRTWLAPVNSFIVSMRFSHGEREQKTGRMLPADKTLESEKNLKQKKKKTYTFNGPLCWYSIKQTFRVLVSIITFHLRPRPTLT